MTSRGYWLLNCLMIFAIVILGWKCFEVCLHPIEGTALRPAAPKQEIPADIPSAVVKFGGTPFEELRDIAEKNIFSPDRKDFPIPAAAVAETPKPIARPQVVLYGVAIGEDYQSATVTNPERALRKEERETRTVRIGGKIGEYTLAKILPDRITMESNGDTFEVLLDDSKNPKRKIAARATTKPDMIASLQSTPIPPSVEAPKPTPSQESIEKPREQVQAQTAAPLPFNKYTYQLLGPSTTVRRGRILPGPSGQEPGGNANSMK